MKDAPRYRLDELRRFATALAVARGVPPVRAAALSAQLLWYDGAGAPEHGVHSLPGWLERLEAGAVDPVAEGRVGPERAGTAVLDAQNGLPPLLLARAAELASEKARDTGVGLVRVVNLGAAGPAAAVLAEAAVGPLAAAALGPRDAWALAVPSLGGLPAVYDSALAADSAQGRRGAGALGVLAPWAAALVSDDGWLVAAWAVAALEPLGTFQERAAAAFEAAAAGKAQPGWIVPARWEECRRQVRERGAPIPAAAWEPLTRWAERLGVPPPEPVPHG